MLIFTPSAKSPYVDRSKEIFDIYDLHQMVNEPTRITAKSRTLIDLYITIRHQKW